MLENSFVERLLLATVGLYPKKKKVTLLLLFIFQIQEFEGVKHNGKRRGGFIQIGFNRTSIDCQYSVTITVSKLFVV